MVLSQFYLAIMGRLLAANIGIKFIDLFNDQFNQEGDELPFNLPAAFLEYEPIAWESLGNKRQAADIVFKLHVASDMVYVETTSIETTADRNAGLVHLELIDKIKKALHGFSGSLSATPGLLGGSFGSIRPTGLTPDNNHGAVVISVMDFNVRITDDSSKAQLQTIQKPPLDIQTDLE